MVPEFEEELQVIKIVVDMTKCKSFAQCCFVAPDNFMLNSKIDVLEYIPEADDSLLNDIEGAREICPTKAISYTQVP